MTKKNLYRKILDKALASDDPRDVWAIAALGQDRRRKGGDGPSYSLGSLLLSGTDWSGTFNFRNTEQRQMFYAYATDERPTVRAAIKAFEKEQAQGLDLPLPDQQQAIAAKAPRRAARRPSLAASRG